MNVINYPKTAAFVTLPRDRLRSYFRWMYPSNNFTGFVAFLAQCQSDISIIVKLIKGLAARIARSNLVLVKAISVCSAYSHVVFPAAAEYLFNTTTPCIRSWHVPCCRCIRRTLPTCYCIFRVLCAVFGTSDRCRWWIFPPQSQGTFP